MTVFTAVRERVADQLDDAADLISHSGFSTGKPFDTDYGVDLTDIDDGTPLSLSPIAAIVMAQHPGSFGIGWSIPKGWNRNNYWLRYPALAVFAQHLVDSGQVYEPLENPAATIELWTGGNGRTEDQVATALHGAATAVRDAKPTSKLLLVISAA